MNCSSSLFRVLAVILFPLVLVGCTANSSHEQEMRMANGYIYYCDGAGGGGLINWSGGLKQGLKDAGYTGTGEVFPWNTGLGVIADQDSSVDYKRGKARKLAQQAATYSQNYPDAPVTFMGLSADTSVVVFAMEELPRNTPIENVVLCGASISSTYDLTRALENLDGKLYIFTSQKDEVLGFLVPMAGTADRASGTVPSAGLRGFRMPSPGSPQTRSQYTKIVTIPWRPEFTELGYHGGHTDVLSEKFVAAHIAPRLMKKVASTPSALASTAGKVHNPDYDRWAKFGEGSYIVVDGYQIHNGVKSPIRLKSTLVSKSRDRVLVEREMYLLEEHAKHPVQIHSLIAEAWIDPSHHPGTDPNTKSVERQNQQVDLLGKQQVCTVKQINAPGSYPDWGSDVKANAYGCPGIPGGLAKINLESNYMGGPFTFEGKVVDYKIMPDRGTT